MRALLDTHAFLWFITDNPQLSQPALDLLQDPGNDVVVSIASLWEIAIKSNLGKLQLAKPFDELFPQQIVVNNFGILPIMVQHLTILVGLEHFHRDPFDRLIISQAISEDLPVVTRDAYFQQYPVRLIW